MPPVPTVSIDKLACAVIFFLIFLANFSLAGLELLSPDASLYLDAGRNLVEGRGAIVTYNLYQSWLGKSCSLFTYTHPLFPIVAGFLWKIAAIKGVILFNIFLLAANSSLLYLIMRLTAGPGLSLLAALLAGFSANVMCTAIYPWADQLYLVIFFIAVYLYLAGKADFFMIGAILGAGCLARAAGINNACAFFCAMLMVEGWRDGRWRAILGAIAGFILVLGGYELFCFLRYGEFYPQYRQAGFIDYAAQYFPGAWYACGKQVLHAVYPVSYFSHRWFDANGYRSMVMVHFGQALAVMALALLYAVLDFFTKKRKVALFLVITGLASFAGVLMTTPFVNDFDGVRVNLLTYVCLTAVGVAAAYELWRVLPFKLDPRIGVTLFLFFILPFAYLTFSDYVAYRSGTLRDYAGSATPAVYALMRTLPKDSLIATDALGDAFLFGHPCVSLPVGQAVTPKNIKDYLAIYRPDYIFLRRSPQELFYRRAGFSVVVANGSSILLKR